MGDQQDDENGESEDLLSTIEQVEETLSVMTSVVSHLREQLVDRLENDENRSATDDFFEQVDNPDGVWH